MGENCWYITLTVPPETTTPVVIECRMDRDWFWLGTAYTPGEHTFGPLPLPEERIERMHFRATSGADQKTNLTT